MGTRKALLLYYDLAASILDSNRPCLSEQIDQALHNIIYHLFRDTFAAHGVAVKSPPNCGRDVVVFSMHFPWQDHYERHTTTQPIYDFDRRAGVVSLRSTATIPPLVHQYDRDSRVAGGIRRKYSLHRNCSRLNQNERFPPM